MASELLTERFAEIERLALAAGLDPYEIHYFEVPASVICEVASYGLPTRYSHWSFGRSLQYQRIQQEMGFSKIYELILNNNPSMAFLDNTNPDVINLLICAHCLGHSAFFKNNIMFRQSGETTMIQTAKHHAEIIDQYRKDYGDDEVDEWLDIALALQHHIDIYRGLKRTPYPKRHVAYEERAQSRWEDLVKNPKPLVKKVIKGLYIPPYPEKDLLWFLSEYANLEPWQKRIFEIVRRESYYFYPQYRTKIMNEGWASYWHSELMRQYALGNDNDYGVKDIKYPLTPEEHLDFVAAHEKVVQPGVKFPLKIEVPEIDPNTGRTTGRKVKVWNPVIDENPGIFSRATRINPYYVGFRMLHDIKKRWDKYFEQGYMENEWKEKIPVTINGNQKIREVMMEEDDVSFFRNYLTEELCSELHLFAYGSIDDYEDDYGIQEEIEKRTKGNEDDDDLGEMPIDEKIINNRTVAVNSKNVKTIVDYFAKDHNNYGVPCIVVRRVDESGLLRLEHLPEDKTNLDIRSAESVLKYIHKAWGRPVEIVRKGKDKTWTLSYDGISFEVNHEAKDYPEILEQNQTSSAW